jgi:hypothetical protein
MWNIGWLFEKYENNLFLNNDFLQF